MAIYTTEIASDSIRSDNPIHQRLLQSYYLAQDKVKGDLLEIGCGEGRGVHLLQDKVNSFTGLDKIAEVVESLTDKYPEAVFKQTNIPPLEFADEQFDTVISFQVIEHIKKDGEYLKEIARVLKPGGVAMITTPNIKKSLSRNPWHIREYTAAKLSELCKPYFSDVKMLGITGNDKVIEYYEQNKASVNKLMRFDVLNLQYRLPAFMLKIPYEFMNRLNRNKLQDADDSLVASIRHDDYLLTEEADSALDLFAVLTR